MKIFITWSGHKSKEIANAFKSWIPSVIQAAKPYFSPSDIDKGARWNNEISKELEQSKIGILCLTRENLNEPWVMFEAGALSKSLDTTRVCPMLFGIDPSDIKGPLVQFQATPFTKDEVKKLIKTINAEMKDSALEAVVLNNVFEKWWPDLEEQINNIMAKPSIEEEKSIRSDRDILEEILNLTRSLRTKHILPARISAKSGKYVYPQFGFDVYKPLERLCEYCVKEKVSNSIKNILLELLRNLTRWKGMHGIPSPALEDLVDTIKASLTPDDDHVPF